MPIVLIFTRYHPLQLKDKFQTLYILVSGTYNVYADWRFYPQKTFPQEYLEE